MYKLTDELEKIEEEELFENLYKNVKGLPIRFDEILPELAELFKELINSDMKLTMLLYASERD